MRDSIVVIGGYGAVGQIISADLSTRFPGKVYAAGRSLEKATQFAEKSQGKILPMAVDVASQPSEELLKKARVVVMCLDQQNTSFMRAILAAGIHYTDVTASTTFMQEASTRDSLDNPTGTAILSVGLAPGLTNLLAKTASNELDHTEDLRINLLLGLGDAHGKAAVEWTVDALNMSFEVREQGSQRKVSSFTDSKKADFGTHWGVRKVYRFPFSDQITLTQTVAAPTIGTRLCFDSRLATGALSLLRATGLQRLLRQSAIRRAAVYLFHNIKLGSNRYALRVDAIGSKKGLPATYSLLLEGKEQSQITARVAAASAAALYKSSFAPGIYQLEQVLELSRLQEWLAEPITIKSFENGL